MNQKTSTQNRTRDIEIKNKQTVTRGEQKRITRGKGEGPSRNTYEGPMDKAKGGQDRGWELGMGGAGVCCGGKMETTVLEQQ